MVSSSGLSQSQTNMLGQPTRRGARRSVAISQFMKRRRLLIILVLLLLVASSSFGALWVYRKFKAHQSASLTEMAASYLKDRKPSEARMALETALRLQPANAHALRLLAKLQVVSGENAVALGTWGRLAGAGGMTVEDLSIYAQSAASAGEWALAERLADAAARGGNSVLRHMLRAELEGRKNNPVAMEGELRAAVEADKSGNAKAVLARFLLQRPMTADSASELRGLLKELSKRKDVTGAEALANGLTRGLVPLEEFAHWIAGLRNHPGTTPNFLLVADAAEMQFAPTAKDKIVASVVARLQGRPLDERVAGLQWLVRFGEPAKGVGLIGRDEALQRRELLMSWIDAQSVAQNWPAVLDALSQPEVPLPLHFLNLYRGRTLKAMGRDKEGMLELQEAYRTAMKNPEEFRQALAYLNVAGEDALFEQGFSKLLSEEATATESFRALLPSFSVRQDSAHLIKAYQIDKEVSPSLASDLSLQNDMDYLSLVLGRPVDAAVVALRSEGNPRDFALRSTQGLMLLLAGRPQEALACLDACEPDVHVANLPPHQKLVVALTLAANGRASEANSVIALVPPFAMSRQEVELIRRYFPQNSPLQMPPAEKGIN